MRGSFCLLATVLVSSLAGGQQYPDCASINKIGDEVTLKAESWDPVLAIGSTLVGEYGIIVSVESPKWEFPGDTEDVAVADPVFSAQHGNIHYRLMKRHTVEVRFSVAGGRVDVPGLMHQLADAANREMPYAYRLDQNGNDYTLVPTRTRNEKGDLEEVQPLLDRHVRIPRGLRTIAQHADLMADQLSQQTGLHVNCCQSFVEGIPWGIAEVEFQAYDKPAREVVRSLIRLEQETNSQAPAGHPDFDHWTVRCDGTGVTWCVIEVEGHMQRCP